MAKQKSARGKYKFLLVIPLLLLIIGIYYFSQPSGNSKQKILNDISSLLTFSNSRPLTDSDFSQLRSDVQNDSIALGYIDNAVWFADHNIQVHVGHNLSDLYNYYYYGKDEVCVPHEVEHIGDYIRYNDYSLIPSTLDRISRGYSLWYENIQTYKQKFPATYSNFDELSAKINATISNIQQGNYLPTLDNITYITQYDYEGCVIGP